MLLDKYFQLMNTSKCVLVENMSTFCIMTAMPLMHTHLYSSLKFSHPSLLPLDTISLVFRNWLSDATESTAGATVSSVMMHLAFEAWSRYNMSLADNWVVPGIKTIPGRAIKLVWDSIFYI